NVHAKNCVAQCSLKFGALENVSTPGFRTVTVVPTGTVIRDGTMVLVFVLSAAEVAVPFERAIQIVLGGTMPAALLSTGRRMFGMGRASGASWLPETYTGSDRGPV